MRHLVLTTCLAAGAVAAAHADPRPLTLNLEESFGAAHARTGGGLTIACIGDSLVTRESTWSYYVRDALKARRGDGGGYLGAGAGFSWKPSWTCDQPVPMGQSRAVETGFTVSAPNSGQRPLPWGACSPDGAYFLQSAARTRWEFAPHLRTTARAICTWTSDPPASLEPAPDIASRGHGVYTCTWHDCAQAWTDGDLVLHGWDLGHDPGDEVVWHRMGRGGAGAASFLQTATDPSRAITETVMAAVRTPDLILIMIDPASEDTPETYEADLRAYLDWLTTTVWPAADVVLITHHAFIPSIEDEADLYLQLAIEHDYGYINLYDRWTLTEMQENDMLDDTVHLSCLGGQIVGQAILDDLLGVVPACRADLDASGRVDFADLNTLLLHWNSGDGGDVDGDGETTFADLNELLMAWNDPC